MEVRRNVLSPITIAAKGYRSLAFDEFRKVNLSGRVQIEISEHRRVVVEFSACQQIASHMKVGRNHNIATITDHVNANREFVRWDLVAMNDGRETDW